MFSRQHKDRSLAENEFDASNRDGGIDIQAWPTLGMHQPDAIAVFAIAGVTHIATANEGDARDCAGHSEEQRVGGFTLDPAAYPNAAFLQQNANLGRLLSTTATGDV